MDDSLVQYIKPREIFKLYKITTPTLTRWAKQGKIEYIESPSGHRSYNIQSINNIFKNSAKKDENNEKFSYCYCRVSTHSQKDDLIRQIEYMSSKYPNHKIISDIGSGINFKRKGLKTILESVLKGNVEEIVVAYKDRLCRFGFEMFEWLFSKYNVKLVVLNREISSYEKELSDDLLSIITVFSAKVNGRRKYKNIKEKHTDTEEKEKQEEKEGI